MKLRQLAACLGLEHKLGGKTIHHTPSGKGAIFINMGKAADAAMRSKCFQVRAFQFEEVIIPFLVRNVGLAFGELGC
jgi:hypothetical protein